MKPSGKVTRTLILLKPDAIERNLAGEIIKRFERKGLRLVAAEMRWIDKELAQEHYAEHKGNSTYFKAMTDAITAGPLMAVVLEGPSAVECSRQIIGAQSPLYHSTIGTIRADFAIQEPLNLVHGSDSDSAAAREITLWFGAKMVKPNNTASTLATKKKLPWQAAPDQSVPVLPPGPPKKIAMTGSKVGGLPIIHFDQIKEDAALVFSSGDLASFDKLIGKDK